MQNIYENLWTDYTQLNPQALRIHNMILAEEQKAGRAVSRLENDHVAFRTFNHPKIGIDVFAKIFARHGYQKKGEYHFKEKKLFAIHMEHSDPDVPKVFISELLLEKFSGAFDELAGLVAASVTEDLVKQESFLWSGRSWQPKQSEFDKLSKLSEYASWVYAFGFRTNHFTISVNHLKAFTDLITLNSFLKSNGVALNASGGEIKGSKEVCLEQSSTMSEKIEVQFQEGPRSIPSCYYEFAQRFKDKNGQLYTGFVSDSADKIFESTYSRTSS
jgi:hypothetical protein